jgi:hypothetical protein
MSIDPTAFSYDWRPSWKPLFQDEPIAWQHKLLFNVPQLAHAIRLSWVKAQLGVVVLGTVSTLLLIRGALRSGATLRRSLANRQGLAVLAVGLALLAMLSGFLMTGYYDARYFSPLRWFAGFVSLGLLWRALESVVSQPTGKTCLLLLGVMLAVRRGLFLALYPLALQPSAAFSHPPQYPALLACLAGLPPGPLMFLDDDTEAARFGALTGRSSSLRPRNLPQLDAEQQQEFLRRYRISAVAWFTPPGETLARALGAEPVPGCNGVARLAPQHGGD